MQITIQKFTCLKEDFLSEYDKAVTNLEEYYPDMFKSVFVIKVNKDIKYVHCNLVINWKP